MRRSAQPWIGGFTNENTTAPSLVASGTCPLASWLSKTHMSWFQARSKSVSARHIALNAWSQLQTLFIQSFDMRIDSRRMYPRGATDADQRRCAARSRAAEYFGETEGNRERKLSNSARRAFDDSSKPAFDSEPSHSGATSLIESSSGRPPSGRTKSALVFALRPPHWQSTSPVPLLTSRRNFAAFLKPLANTALPPPRTGTS